MTHREPLRARVREAGGWYQWLNSQLIRLAGPPSVGPFTQDDSKPARTAGCPICGAPMSEHVIDRSGERTYMECP